MSDPALLIIDMQNDFVLPGAPFEVRGALATVPVIGRVLDAFRAGGYPVVHITRAYRPDGSDVERFRRADFERRGPAVVPGTAGCAIVSRLAPLAHEYRVTKPRFSAFMGTALDLLLRRLRVGSLVVTGTQFPNCIRATVMDAVALDYAVTLVTDATSAQEEPVARANIVDLRNIGVRCIDAVALLRTLGLSAKAVPIGGGREQQPQGS